MADRPNVLWVCTDQQFAGAMSCAGNDYVDTPAMDSVAAAGTRFENAYCTNPLCNPSRASLLTGRMPSDVGVSGNNQPIDEAYRDQELGNLFDAAGYDCAYAGKFHVPDSRHIDDGHGFEELCGLDDRRVPEVCADFLADAADGDEPFFLAAHFDNPHNICEWSRDYNAPWGLVEDVPVEECPPLPANHAIPPYEPKAVRDKVAQSGAMGAMDGATADEWRQYRHAYFRLVEKADAGFGRILDALREAGLDEDTLVVFTSDHGDHHGAHELIQKMLLYEESVRIPFLVSPPGRAIDPVDASGHDDSRAPVRDGDVSEHLVSNGLDLLPTLCDYAGVDAPDDLRGRSVRPIVDGEDPDDWREQVVVESNVGGRMIRTERYKYVVYKEGRNNEQLIDLQEDPGEMVNLANDATYADLLDEFRERLLEWCLETDDRFGERYHHPGVPMIPGHDFEDLWPLFYDEPPGMR